MILQSQNASWEVISQILLTFLFWFQILEMQTSFYTAQRSYKTGLHTLMNIVDMILCVKCWRPARLSSMRDVLGPKAQMKNLKV